MNSAKSNPEYDYIIVGAGSAGCTLANRLSADPDCQVLLLEAGGTNRSLIINMPSALSIPMSRKAYNWGYESEPEPHMQNRRLHCPRGKGLGGSSAINGMVYVRGHPDDFNNWQRLGAQGWDYASCLPYFKRAEGCVDGKVDTRYRGTEGELTTTTGIAKNPLYVAFLIAASLAGHELSADLNGSVQEGFGALPMTVRNGVRCSAARAYLDPIAQRSNLTVRTHAQVSRVNFDGLTARSVSWHDARSKEPRSKTTSTAVATREIILSAGAIDTPTLLQRSGVGCANRLRKLNIDVVNDLPTVGENLMDHLEVYVQQACTQPVTLHRWLNPIGKGWIGARWLFNKTGLGATNHFEVGGFIRSDHQAARPDIQFHFLPAAMNYDGSQVARGHGFQAHVGPMLPESRGSVHIRSQASIDKPTICFNYLSTDRDREVFRTAIRKAREIFAQLMFDSYRGRELSPGVDVQSDQQLDEFVAASAQSAYHPCGTCRMGEDDQAVTNSKGLIRGLNSLRIVDASLFPMITNGNLNAPTIMLAEKIAAEITGDQLAPEIPEASS